MKIQFDIKYRPQIESGEYKVETRDGRPARIICWDIEYYYPQYKIGALIKNDEGEDFFFLTEKGYFCIKESGECDSNNDLLIVTPEEELTEFEQELVNFFNEGNTILPDKDGVYNKRDCEEFLHKSASKLLAIARDELVDEFVQREDEIEHDAWYRGYNQGKAEVLKNLPRWRKWGNGAAGNSDGHPIALSFGAGGIRFVSVLGTTGEKYIMLDDLKKLPGFKEDEE